MTQTDARKMTDDAPLLRRVAEPVGGGIMLIILSYFGAIGNISLWIPLLLDVITIPTRIWSRQITNFFRRRPAFRSIPPVMVFEMTIILSITYLCSWGPLGLGIGLVIMLMHAKDNGPYVWKSAAVIVALVCVVGQIAIATEVIGTLVPQPGVHKVAAATLFIVILCISSTGSNMQARERAERERAEAMAQIERNEERYRALLINSADIVAVIDESQTILPVGLSSGVTANPETGDVKLYDFIHPEDRDLLKDTVMTTMSNDRNAPPNERSASCVVRWETSGDEWRWHEVVALDLRHMPSIQGILVTHRDITERRMLERQLDQARRLESVGQLAAGVAHEINTPVQFLANNLAFLQQVFMALSSDDTSSEDLEFFRSEAPEAIQQSLDGVDHIAQITKAMKAFADPERSTAQICNMQKLIDNTVIVAGQELRTAAELTIIAGDQTEVRCVGNEISQALLSLLTNAAHAIADAGLSTEQGRITIATQQVGNFLRLSVEDNGIGIDDNIKDRLFEPFFTTKEVGRGAGQGLNQVYATVARHGGQVGFDSTPGSGSVFWFDLPLDSSQADARETLSV